MEQIQPVKPSGTFQSLYTNINVNFVDIQLQRSDQQVAAVSSSLMRSSMFKMDNNVIPLSKYKIIKPPKLSDEHFNSILRFVYLTS